MNNLFVLHTQYNIILGTSVLFAKYKDCHNDLVVYAEFTVSEEYKKSLSAIFDRVLFIREKFETPVQGILNVEKEIWKQWKIYKNSPFFNTPYDNVLISQDRPLETLIVNHCKRLNSGCHFADIEEDCYYSIDPEQNKLGYNTGWHNKRSWLLRKIVYGSLYKSDDKKGHYIYGQASYFDTIYALFPDMIRPQLAHLEKLAITNEGLIKACNKLYSSVSINVPDASKYYLFFFDLLERYNNLETIKNIVKQIVDKANMEKAVVLMKYHPRETEKFDFEQDGICEVPFTIPAEKLLCDLDGKDVTVYGNATTAVIVAAKMKYKSISIAGLEGTDNSYMIQQFRNMGIIVPNIISEI